MGRSASSIMTCVALLIVVLCSLLCMADPHLAHEPNGITPKVDVPPALQRDNAADEVSEVPRSLGQETGRDWFGITQALSNYIASYTSTAATWLKWPYFGVSTGVATIMVFFVIIYILIIVSGAVVVNGRAGAAPGRQGKLQDDATSGEREQLTHAIMKAIDHVATKFAGNQLFDNQTAGPSSEPNRIGHGAAGLFKRRRARREVKENGRQSINAYVSSSVYNALTWLSKPFMGYFVVLAAIILYMVVIVQIAMTSNVFPLASLGRALSGSANFRDSRYGDLVKTAEHVMKAINDWEVRDFGNGNASD